MSSKEMYDQITEMNRKSQMATTKLVETKTKGTDIITSYARDMPSFLIRARHFAFTLLVIAVTDPASVALFRMSLLLIHFFETIMVKWLALAEVLWDRDLERDYQAVATRDKRLADSDLRVNLDEMEVEN